MKLSPSVPCLRKHTGLEVMASSHSFTSSGSRPIARLVPGVSSPLRRSLSGASLVHSLKPAAAATPSMSGLSKVAAEANPQSAHYSFSGFSHSQQQLDSSTTPVVECFVASSTAATAGNHSAYASLSRLLVVNQPSTLFRIMARVPRAGPISFLIFLFGIIAAIAAVVRNALVRKARSCSCCKGYGIVRCNLCKGQGSVGWSAKFSYSDG